MKKTFLKINKLDHPKITYGFFTRLGGFSNDAYESLNCSYTNGDNYFNVKLYDKFKNYYRQYNYMIRKNLMQIEKKCPICLQNTRYAVKCYICKSYFHVDCIFYWLRSIVKKKCPICRSDNWEIVYPYYSLLKNEKIPKNIII